MRDPSATPSARRPTPAARAARLLLATALLAPVAAGADTPLLRIELRPTAYQETLHYLENVLHAAVENRRPDEGRLELVVTEGDLPTLWLLGEVTLLERSRPYAEIAAERRAASPTLPPQEYKTYGEILEWMDRVEARYPEIARKVNVTQMFGLPRTWQGNHDIWAIKLSDHVGQHEDEPAVLVDSLHHANEMVTMEFALDIVDRLTDAYGRNPTATGFVDDYQIWVIPVVNPDGLDYIWSTNNLWRKNRRNNGGGVFGVDLNRNYPFLWGVCGNGSPNPSSSTYIGPEPLSEPEVKAVVSLGLWLRPVIYLSHHSGSGPEILSPYRCAKLAEAPIVNTLRDLYRGRMGYGWRLASSSGESFEWFYNQVSSLGFLSEVGTAGTPPFSQVKAMLAQARSGWIFLLESLEAGPLVQGHVTDSATGLPVEAEIASSRVAFTEGERRACEAGFGRYSWFLPLEGHTLTFSAPGYVSKQVPVNVALGGVSLDVELDPAP
jgi:hypothetical protein